MVWSSDVDHKHILVVNKPAHIQLPAFVFTAYTWELQGHIFQLRGTFVVDDKLTFAIHGDIYGDDPSNCVYGKTLVCICISIYSTLLLKNTK